MMNFTPIASPSTGNIQNALGSLKQLMSARTDAEMSANVNNLAASLSDANEESTYAPSPELACRPASPREHRRPIITEVRTMSGVSSLTTGDGIIAEIFTEVFSGADAKRFLYADGSLKASVEGRQLAGLAFKWDLIVWNRFNRHTGGTASAGVAAAIDEIRVWTEEELEPIKRVLNQCTVQVFGTSSNDPGMDETQLSYFGEKGQPIPRALHPHTFFKEKEARVLITTPTLYPDIVIPAAIDGRTPQVNVWASLTVGGLFLDRQNVPKALQIKK